MGHRSPFLLRHDGGVVPYGGFAEHLTVVNINYAALAPYGQIVGIDFRIIMYLLTAHLIPQNRFPSIIALLSIIS